MLVIETLGAPPPASRRRRKPRAASPDGETESLPLGRVTAVRAFEPFDDEAAADAWLAGATASEDASSDLVREGVGLLNRALHAQATATANPYVAELAAEQAVRVRLGYGSGKEVASGRFALAREVDVRPPGAPSRRRRQETLYPQERVAAVLGNREAVDVCETLLLRARADLDAGRTREAALQLRVGLEALLIELEGGLTDAGHEEDMGELGARRAEAGEAANAALRGELDENAERSLRELVEICERVLRRRRVLRS